MMEISDFVQHKTETCKVLVVSKFSEEVQKDWKSEMIKESSFSFFSSYFSSYGRKQCFHNFPFLLLFLKKTSVCDWKQWQSLKSINAKI